LAEGGGRLAAPRRECQPEAQAALTPGMALG
jgi:hypothetical protein